MSAEDEGSDDLYCKVNSPQFLAYARSQYSRTVWVPLNSYQARNLLRLLRLVWAGKISIPNPGDWFGEVPMILEGVMREAGGEFTDPAQRANDGKSPFERVA